MTIKILTAITSILIAGGAVAGYKVIRDKKVDVFENSIHPVMEVIDGDTIKIPYYKTEALMKIRLIGVDAPEKGECYYEESRDFLKELLEDKEIKIEKDITGEDKYQRLLRYVFIPSDEPEEDDIFVNRLIVKEGYGIAYASAPDKKYRDLLSSAQQDAMKKKKGIWGECEMKSEMEEALKMREIDSVPNDPDCMIKGNISERGYGKTYLIEGCDNYNRVKIDIRKGEQYFCTEEEAINAGFRKATNCP